MECVQYFQVHQEMNLVLVGRLQLSKWKFILENQLFSLFRRQVFLLIQGLNLLSRWNVYKMLLKK